MPSSRVGIVQERIRGIIIGSNTGRMTEAEISAEYKHRYSSLCLHQTWKYYIKCALNDPKLFALNDDNHWRVVESASEDKPVDDA